jgi:hypothetical protein
MDSRVINTEAKALDDPPLDEGEMVDQKQLLYDRKNVIHYGIWVAQSFKPSISPLAKVLLKIEKNIVINAPLEFSIREDLYGEDLAYMSLPAGLIPYHIWWVEFDFEDVEVKVGKTYYIVLRSKTPTGKSYYWLYKQNTTDMGDPYERGEQWQSIDGGYTWSLSETEGYYVDSTFQTITYYPDPDLECYGVLNWSAVKPGSIVTGSFVVENIGSPLSHLNWKITYWPYWGVWTFTPPNGSHLTPEDGPFTVHVSVKAPNVTRNDYSGHIKIVNVDDDNDYGTIDVSLVTSRFKRSMLLFQILERLMQHFPMLKQLLSFIPIS